jgi:hypothetical protein
VEWVSEKICNLAWTEMIFDILKQRPWGSAPNPARGPVPLTPHNFIFYFLALRENKKWKIKKGSQGLRPLAGLGGAQGLAVFP